MKQAFESPMFFCDGLCEQSKYPAALPAGYERIHPVKPPVPYYHYSAGESQGALICETKGFPPGYDPQKEEFVSAYSDRIAMWDSVRLQRACEIADSGDQGWAYALPKLRDKKLREFAQVALDLPSLPLHVRVVHHFNVATGYSCPTVEAVIEKQGQAE